MKHNDLMPFSGADFQALFEADVRAARDIRAVADGPFLRAFLDWISGRGPAVEDPSALLAASGVVPAMLGWSMTGMLIRDSYIARIGYSVPTPGFVAAMRPLGPVLEVGAGRGYLSAILRGAGLDAVATDLDPLAIDGFGHLDLDGADLASLDRLSLPVERLDIRDAIRAYPGRAVLCSWPSYQSDWIAEAARDLVPGQALAIIGEGGGCTGDDGLFDLVEQDELRLERTDHEAIWSFPGIHDSLRIFRRR